MKMEEINFMSGEDMEFEQMKEIHRNKIIEIAGKKYNYTAIDQCYT